MMLFLFLYFPLLFCRIVSAQDLFYFSQQPEDTIVKSGASTKLECQVSHRENIIYYWNLNDTRLGNSTRKKQVGSNLIITRADRFQDTGQYSCIAENVTSGYSITSRPANLEVIWLALHASVQLQAPFAEKEIQKGGEVILRCVVEGNGEIKYDWFRNEEQLLKVKGKRIHIKDVSPANNGVYRCRAHNEAGTVESKGNFALKISGVSYPQVKTLPKDALVKKGETARLDCSFGNSDETRWYLKNELLEDNEKSIFFPAGPRFIFLVVRDVYIHVLKLTRANKGDQTSVNTSSVPEGTQQYFSLIFKNGTLILKNFTSTDEGLYVCRGIKKIDETNEKVQSYSAKLRFSYIEEFSSASLEPVPSNNILVMREMKPYEVGCFPPKAIPPAKVWWEDQSGKTVSLPETTRALLVFESPRVDSESGNYTCFAENLAGVRNITLRMIVSVAPVVPSDMELVTVDEGDSFTFSCPYKGTPYPATTVRWKKDKKYLSQSRMTVNKINGSLTLRQAQPSDRGFYICEVNTTGFKPVDSRPYKLNIIEKLKFMPRPVSKKLELGVATKIPCKAQGSPTPVIRWLKERVPGEMLPSHVHDINGTLHFDTVYMTDKGKYICIATSTQGTINATVDIDVIVAPRFTIKPKNPTEALEGYPIMLHCMAEGDPIPTIKWDKNGEMNGLDAQRFTVFENGSLLLRYVNSADKGVYGCTAGNSGGLKREEAVLIVRDGYQPNEGSESEDSMMTKTVTITLSAAAAYMILVIGLMIWCRYRRRKRKEAILNTSPENILLAKTENGDAIISAGEKPDTNEIKRENGRKSDGTETTHSQSSGQSKRSSKSNHYEKLAFSRQNLSDLRFLGHGMFGQVFVAKAENVSSPVVVKSLQNVRSENCLIEFKRETDMFHRLLHDNVARLIGLCRDAEPHYMILEYTDWGELKHFLQTTRKERSKLSVGQIMDIAKQISLGMEHLSNARFVHKDLATRNCIITSDFRVKVSLIGLSKDVYRSDYTIFRSQLIPLRWLPYEAVFEDDYSTKSDVYSFAVLCWEIFHQGEQPFYNLPDSVIIDKLQGRELILKPSKNAPAKISALLADCLSYNPRDRPTFSNIAILLGEALEDL